MRKVLLIIPTVKVPQLSTVQAKEDCAKWIGLPYQVDAIFFIKIKIPPIWQFDSLNSRAC